MRALDHFLLSNQKAIRQPVSFYGRESTRGGPAANPRVTEGKMKKWAPFSAMLLSVSYIFLPGLLIAEEMKGRIVHHSTKTETIEVGDVSGHILGIAQHSGLILYSTGEVATTKNSASFDFVDGKGTFTNYRTTTFKDGATLFTKGGGTATPVDGGKRTAFEGPVECIGGTGRFEGYKGTGTYKGERVGDLKTGADTYIDFTLNCKKP
jgi:hypothetical protein